jgi:hypothetical protein
MHLREFLSDGFAYHQQALLLITVGFAILTGISMVAIALQGNAGQGRAKASRMFGAMCSALFAVSFVHFGSWRPQQAWASELVFHHAGIPLALFVLLQDYRFLLLDAFVRFLANAFLAAVLTFAFFYAIFSGTLVEQRISENPLYGALLLVGFCLLLIGFAFLRNRIQRWLTTAVFRRPELGKVMQQIQSRAALFNEESEFLPWVYDQVAQFMQADRIEEVSESGFFTVLGNVDLLFPVPASDVARIRSSDTFAWVEAIAPIRLAHGDVRYLLLGRRRGGRRYLSEDLQVLSRFSAVILEQVERFRNSEIRRLVSQAELRALQSQINPHFLFNALNTLYGIIPREASGARNTVLHLADIFRYFLQSDKTFIRLSEELEIVKAYLEIERLRLGPRLETVIEVDDSALPVMIPVLSIQPLIENAIKHGISTKAGPGMLRLRANMCREGLLVVVEDSSLGTESRARERGSSSHTGVGLNNVRRRLQLCFGPDAHLVMESGLNGTTVQFSIPIEKAAHVI